MRLTRARQNLSLSLAKSGTHDRTIESTFKQVLMPSTCRARCLSRFGSVLALQDSRASRKNLQRCVSCANVGHNVCFKKEPGSKFCLDGSSFGAHSCIPKGHRAWIYLTAQAYRANILRSTKCSVINVTNMLTELLIRKRLGGFSLRSSRSIGVRCAPSYLSFTISNSLFAKIVRGDCRASSRSSFLPRRCKLAVD